MKVFFNKTVFLFWMAVSQTNIPAAGWKRCSRRSHQDASLQWTHTRVCCTRWRVCTEIKNILFPKNKYSIKWHVLNSVALLRSSSAAGKSLRHIKKIYLLLQLWLFFINDNTVGQRQLFCRASNRLQRLKQNKINK